MKPQAATLLQSESLMNVFLSHSTKDGDFVQKAQFTQRPHTTGLRSAYS